MSGLRHRRFTLALGSSYAALACTIAYSFLLVPLCLAHLPLGVLGLWFLGLQACRYFELVDLGVSGASLRLISQAKLSSETYPPMISAAWMVQMSQGVLVAGIGTLAANSLACLLVTDPGDRKILAGFIFWVFFLNGLRLGLRIFPNLLRINQLQHLLNVLTSLGILVNLGVLFTGMRLGWGSISLLLGFSAEWLIQTAGPMVLMATRKNLPHGLAWARPRWREIQSLGRFGLAIFQINSLRFLLESAPMVLVGRWVGPEASAIWSIVSRAGTCLRDLIAQVHISAAPAFYDLMARGERARMAQAFTRLATISLSLACLLFSLFAAWDAAFVGLWTSGRCVAPGFLPALLAAILWLQIWNAWSAELSVSLFKTRPLALAFLQEAFVFGLACVPLHRFGLLGWAGAALLASLTSSFPRGWVLFRELWAPASLSQSWQTLLIRGGLVVATLLLASRLWQAIFPPSQIWNFSLAVVCFSLLAAGGWILWLGPAWLISLARGSRQGMPHPG